MGRRDLHTRVLLLPLGVPPTLALACFSVFLWAGGGGMHQSRVHPLFGVWNHGTATVRNGITCWSAQGPSRPTACPACPEEVRTTIRVCLEPRVCRQTRRSIAYLAFLAKSAPTVYPGVPSILFSFLVQTKMSWRSPFTSQYSR